MIRSSKLALAAIAAACVAMAGAQTVKVKGEVEVTRQQERPSMSQMRQHDIKVLVNGQAIAFPDQAPVMMGNRVLVPLRGVFEELGATVNWDASKNLVTATRNGQTTELYIGKTTAMV